MLDLKEYLHRYKIFKTYNKRYNNSLKWSIVRHRKNIEIYQTNQEKRVLICLHSFDWGGAEQFAYETIKFVQQNNIPYEIFVEKKTEMSDSFKAVLDFSLITYAKTYQDSGEQIVSLIHSRCINFISIHHSYSAYKALKKFPRNIFVIDSLHIIEYQTGGYPYLSAEHSTFINVHHVVSKGLMNFLMAELGVPKYKLELGYLFDKDSTSKIKKKHIREEITIGFLGRFEKQKRPELFVEVAKKLQQQLYDFNISFVMQGTGSLNERIKNLVSLYKIKNFTFLNPISDIDDFHKRIDILLNCSENEGLTLTGIECAKHGTIFISTNVGQQIEITSRKALLEYQPRMFINQAVLLIKKIIYNHEIGEEILAHQNILLNSMKEDSFEKNILKKYFL